MRFVRELFLLRNVVRTGNHAYSTLLYALHWFCSLFFFVSFILHSTIADHGESMHLVLSRLMGGGDRVLDVHGNSLGGWFWLVGLGR